MMQGTNNQNMTTRLPSVKETFELRGQVVHNLMPFKVREILLVSSLYDAFIIEEEGLISEMVIGEYRDLRLSSPPRVTRVPSGKAALKKAAEGDYDLIITMSKNIGINPFTFGRKIKEKTPDIPVLLLATDISDLLEIQHQKNGEGIDRVFYWYGDSNLFLAIVKLIEDEKNVSHDVDQANVQVIILVEDSIRYYSMFLPLLYAEIVHQTERSISEDVNELQRLLRRRARPKILFARSYEEALSLFQRFEDHVLGIISDIGFLRNKQLDPEAGFSLVKKIRQINPHLPILMQSSHVENKEPSLKLGAVFAHKHAPTLLEDIRGFLLDHLGFGDFVFYQPYKKGMQANQVVSSFGQDIVEVDRASTMKEFEQKILEMPLECIRFHAERYDFSNWLMARGEFTLATILRSQKISDFQNLKEVREYLYTIFNETRRKRQLGVVTDFNRQKFEFESSFTRIGGESFGGKGRGIAFIRSLLYRYDLQARYKEVNIIVPNTVAIATEEFDRFVNDNDIRHKFEEKNLSDKEIAEIFLQGSLHASLQNKLREVLQFFSFPLAVRSSSLLEDSQNHPFAGLYSTYMLLNNDNDIDTRLEQLCQAIKLVFASVFYKDALQYIKATAATPEEEKMAVIIQELIGQQYGNRFYPTFSGVAQSYNYYPVDRQKAKEGLVSLAAGLGYAVVGGENVVRFSPKTPRIIPDFSSTQQTLENAQKYAYVLDFSQQIQQLSGNEQETLQKIPLKDLQADGSLHQLMSHFDRDDGVIRDGISDEYPNIVTFAGILKYDFFPLSSILLDLLRLGKKAMGCPVEMEFAVVLPDENHLIPPTFAILQIRPLVISREQGQVVLDSYQEKDALVLRSERALGNGLITIEDIVYVLPDQFDAAMSQSIADEIEALNDGLVREGRNYILIGPGRWGTQDHWLGIPVHWGQISAVKAIVETDLKDFHVKPSQGTHFLQNIISQGIGYINVPYDSELNFVDWHWLSQQTIIRKRKHVHHVRTNGKIQVIIDGKNRKAMVMKPH